MTWIKVHQSLRDHRKTFALSDELDIPEAQAIGHCVTLWLWALDNAPDGNLPTDRAVARGALWSGDPHEFVAALITVGFITEDRTINDWDEYAGTLISQRKAHAAKMRRLRARHDDVPGTSDNSAGHVPRQSRVEKSRVEQSRETRLSPVPDSVSRDARDAPKSKRKCRLADDWEPSAKNVADAEGQGLSPADIDRQANLFRDHWLGNGEPKLDWDATWRNWIRRSAQFDRPRGTSANGHRRIAARDNVATDWDTGAGWVDQTGAARW